MCSYLILFDSLILHPVFCDDLPALENGMIEYDEQASPRPEGTVATHSCNEGFSLDGVVERVCLETGQFSETPPTCERKFLVMKMLTFDCQVASLRLKSIDKCVYELVIPCLQLLCLWPIHQLVTHGHLWCIGHRHKIAWDK